MGAAISHQPLARKCAQPTFALKRDLHVCPRLKDLSKKWRHKTKHSEFTSITKRKENKFTQATPTGGKLSV